MLLIAAAFTACTEDFKNWVSPQSNGPEDAITVPGFTASTVGAQNLATAGDEVPVFSLNTSSLPEGFELGNARIELTPTELEDGSTTIVKTSLTGLASKEVLQDLIVNIFGVRPTNRMFIGHVLVDAIKDGQAVFIDAGNVEVNIIPEAPIIETAYYYVGASNGWSDSDQTYKFDNGGGDVYENPVFTVTVPAPYNEDGTRADNWFKIAPASAYTSGDFWNNLVGVHENGDTSTEGKLEIGNGFEVGAFNQPASDGATMYRITIDMMDQTYTITPITFKVEPAYYYVGAANGWSDNDKTYVFSNGGVSPLENPVYTCVVPAPFNEDGTRADNWFKIAPESAYTSGDFWNNLFGVANDGDTSTSGELAFGNPGAFCQPASDGAKFYRISINPKEMTYEITPLNFAEYIWEAGVNNDWGAIEQPLYCADGNGTYVGFFYAQDADWSGGMGAFKFTGAFNNWDNGNYGTGTINDDGLSGTLINDGGSGNVLATPGFYRAEVNLANMTYSLTPISGIGIIGPAQAGGWDVDTDLAYNPETKAWEGTFELAADEFKFRANDNWDINWGGTADNLEQNGANLKIEEAGTYFIQFYPLCQTKSYYTISRQ